jgi:hypothetical protein
MRWAAIAVVRRDAHRFSEGLGRGSATALAGLWIGGQSRSRRPRARCLASSEGTGQHGLFSGDQGVEPEAVADAAREAGAPQHQLVP